MPAPPPPPPWEARVPSRATSPSTPASSAQSLTSPFKATALRGGHSRSLEAQEPQFQAWPSQRWVRSAFVGSRYSVAVASAGLLQRQILQPPGSQHTWTPSPRPRSRHGPAPAPHREPTPP